MEPKNINKFGVVRKKRENERGVQNLVAQSQRVVIPMRQPVESPQENLFAGGDHGSAAATPSTNFDNLPVQPQPQPQPPSAPRLPGLHLSADDFAQGLRYAVQDPHWENGGRDLLFATYKAYSKKFNPPPTHDLPEILAALQDGSFKPSLKDLIECGLTQKALDFMPPGFVVVKTPEGHEVEIATHKFAEEMQGLGRLSPSGRKQLVGVVKMIAEEFGKVFGEGVVGKMEVVTWAK